MILGDENHQRPFQRLAATVHPLVPSDSYYSQMQNALTQSSQTSHPIYRISLQSRISHLYQIQVQMKPFKHDSLTTTLSVVLSLKLYELETIYLPFSLPKHTYSLVHDRTQDGGAIIRTKDLDLVLCCFCFCLLDHCFFPLSYHLYSGKGCPFLTLKKHCLLLA